MITDTTHLKRYYFKCIVEPLKDYFGYTKLEMHELLQTIFLISGENYNSELKTKNIEVKSLSNMDKTELVNYLAEIRIWALTEHGILLQEPNEDMILDSDRWMI